MLLIVSCPIDFGHRELLEVDAVLQLELFAKRQRWPTPPAAREISAEPRRDVDSITRVDV